MLSPHPHTLALPPHALPTSLTPPSHLTPSPASSYPHHLTFDLEDILGHTSLVISHPLPTPPHPPLFASPRHFLLPFLPLLLPPLPPSQESLRLLPCTKSLASLPLPPPSLILYSPPSPPPLFPISPPFPPFPDSSTTSPPPHYLLLLPLLPPPLPNTPILLSHYTPHSPPALLTLHSPPCQPLPPRLTTPLLSKHSTPLLLPLPSPPIPSFLTPPSSRHCPLPLTPSFPLLLLYLLLLRHHPHSFAPRLSFVSSSLMRHLTSRTSPHSPLTPLTTPSLLPFSPVLLSLLPSFIFPFLLPLFFSLSPFPLDYFSPSPPLLFLPSNPLLFTLPFLNPHSFPIPLCLPFLFPLPLLLYPHPSLSPSLLFLFPFTPPLSLLTPLLSCSFYPSLSPSSSSLLSYPFSPPLSPSSSSLLSSPFSLPQPFPTSP
ncbi:hypothetical protein C7M84_012461 [Penaeus vannamei]|uniref:Uncharacterized protein n=1 Tax=Penaeus vannamei TaxID=6689 RepID=A0A423SZA1_PENVA|nr:hypothetical protein C7M84_012461 [Penaeus vannamei]